MPYGVGELDAIYAPANDYKPALASSIVIPGNLLLYGFAVSNTNAAAQYIMVFDAQTLPADTSIPCYWLNVAGSGDREVGYLPPREFLQGIVLCNSSTNTSKTIGAADCLFDVQFQTLA